MQKWTEYHIDFLANDTQPQAEIPAWLTLSAIAEVPKFHATLPQYHPTPLLNLHRMAADAKIAGLYVKNEAERLGLNAFKALGSSYAISKIICRHLGLDLSATKFTDLQDPSLQEKIRSLVFATATDGNHGRGVAWTAAQLGCHAHIFMPAGTEAERVEAIRQLGAEVTVTDGSYDETVALAHAESAAHGWTLVQDTAFPGYEEIPQLIIQGYATMAAEIADQMAAAQQQPTHIFLQAGVGSMAGAMLATLKQYFPSARFIIIEPQNVACCMLAAATQNDAAAITGIQQTVMAGLNCGTPCPLIMPLLRHHAHFFAACPDFVAAHGMRLAAKPPTGDAAYIAGESGAVGLGLAALLIGAHLPQSRRRMAIDENAVLLTINTEGAMAESVWQQIVHSNALPLPE